MESKLKQSLIMKLMRLFSAKNFLLPKIEISGGTQFAERSDSERADVPHVDGATLDALLAAVETKIDEIFAQLSVEMKIDAIFAALRSMHEYEELKELIEEYQQPELKKHPSPGYSL